MMAGWRGPDARTLDAAAMAVLDRVGLASRQIDGSAGPMTVWEGGAGPPMVLLHGAGDDGACWGPFVTRLRREPGLAGLRVSTPDAPAHGGRRSGPGRTLAWPDLLASAIDSAEALAAGVTLTAPETVFFSHDTAIGRDAEIAREVCGAALCLFGITPPHQQALERADQMSRAGLRGRRQPRRQVLAGFNAGCERLRRCSGFRQARRPLR